MSKSASRDQPRGGAARSAGPIRKIIMRATTDSNPAVDFEKAGPGVLNLLGIYQAFDGATDDEMKSRFAGMRYGDLKKQVAEMVVAHLEPFQQRYRQIVSEPGYLAGVLRDGAERVRPIADDTVGLVKERMGLYR
jgi:tryptophanyl-tRNA synthetase